jgi:hypothetical protein
MGVIRTAVRWTGIAVVGLLVIGVIGAFVLPGGGGGGNATGEQAAVTEGSGTATATEGSTPAVTDGGTQSAAPSTGTGAASGQQTTVGQPEQVRIKVAHDGEWSGSIGPTSSSRSVEGEGNETFDVEIQDGWDAVSAFMQKEGDDDDPMYVRIIYDGQVVQESSTSTAYGTASVTQDFSEGLFGGGVEAGAQAGAEGAPNVTVRVDYDGDWTGNVGGAAASRSVEGSGSEDISVAVQSDWDVVTATMQKDDDGSGTMTVRILIDGEVVQESSTSAEFGVVTVSQDTGSLA